MAGQVALVTGGNSGIGFECARQLAREGWRVLLASRNREASVKALRRITQESGTETASELELDLSSVASVRALVKEIEQRDLPLRALVCNAGLQLLTGPQLSADGYELTFAANHLGHFLLTNLLLSRMIHNAPARIVIVSSGVHDPKQTIGMPHPDAMDIETLSKTGGMLAGRFDGRLAYVNSKLCNLWFAYELQRRLATANIMESERSVTVNSYDPGLVPGSGLAREYPLILRFLWARVLPGLASLLTPVYPKISTMQKSGQALARLVTDPSLAAVSGQYFPSYSRWQAAPSSDASYDVEQAQTLWNASVRMTRLAPAESPLLQA